MALGVGLELSCLGIANWTGRPLMKYMECINGIQDLVLCWIRGVAGFNSLGEGVLIVWFGFAEILSYF